MTEGVHFARCCSQWRAVKTGSTWITKYGDSISKASCSEHWIGKGDSTKYTSDHRKAAKRLRYVNDV